MGMRGGRETVVAVEFRYSDTDRDTLASNATE